jgi:DNA-binding helix-turn-helix protein
LILVNIQCIFGTEFCNVNSQAEAIKKARIETGLSQEQAAAAVGIKVQNWQKYEYGEREPKESMLEKIASALGVGIDKLCRFPLD